MSVQRLDVWIGRDNADVFALKQDGESVAQGSVTKVQIRFGDYCISSDDPAPLVSVTAEGMVTATLGKIAGLEAGSYSGHIFVFDAVAVDGIMWQQIQVDVFEADVCT